MKKLFVALLVVMVLFAGCSMGQTRVRVENRTEFDLELIDIDIILDVPAGEMVEYFVPHGERWIYCHGAETLSSWSITYTASWLPLLFYAE